MKLSAARYLCPALVVMAASGAWALPDLVPDASGSNPYIASEDFSPASCAVQEGCIISGRRRLLRFTAITRNIGPDDLVLGSPAGNPLFEFHPCHGHYHFHDFLQTRLLTTTGTVVSSLKESFCLVDTLRHDPSGPATPRYNCTNQGIQAGWSDVYPSTLDCQYIDITNTPPGDYVLEFHINFESILTEADYANNITTTSVTIDELTPVPENDACADAINVAIEGVPLTGSTESATPDGQGCAASSSTRDVWFRYTPQHSGTAVFSLCDSSFNTVLSLHSGCPGTTANMLACNDDNDQPGSSCSSSTASRLSHPVSQGIQYLVRVSGNNSAHGNYRLVVTNPASTAAREWRTYD